jgi:general stress protein YciG
MPNTTMETQGRRPALRGFAAMDADRRREIARKGGKSVPDEKRSFTQDRTLAAEAGRKGGRQTQSGRGRDSGGGRSGGTA